jgi:DNA mismatch repair ATPase MutS
VDVIFERLNNPSGIWYEVRGDAAITAAKALGKAVEYRGDVPVCSVPVWHLDKAIHTINSAGINCGVKA